METSTPVTSEVPGSIPSRSRASCDRVGDSLWQRRFTPGAPVSSYRATKSPNIVHRANDVLVDAQLSAQYFRFFFYRIPLHRITGDLLNPLTTVGDFAHHKKIYKKLNNHWKPATSVFIWKVSLSTFKWIPMWQGSDEYPTFYNFFSFESSCQSLTYICSIPFL